MFASPSLTDAFLSRFGLQHRIFVRRSAFSIPVVIIISGVTVLAEINVINIYMSYAKEEDTNDLKKKTMAEYTLDTDNTFSVTYDVISIWVRRAF